MPVVKVKAGRSNSSRCRVRWGALLPQDLRTPSQGEEVVASVSGFTLLQETYQWAGMESIDLLSQPGNVGVLS